VNRAACWLRVAVTCVSVAHFLNGCAAGSADDGDTDTRPVPPVAYKGVTAAMWSDINARRVSFGDPNDCQSRVQSIPTSGGVTVRPGADINAALKASPVVFLRRGTYKISKTISLDAGKKLIGVPGQIVTIDASSVDQAVHIRDNAMLINVRIRDARNVGINFYNAINDTGSSNALVYQVSVGRTGLSSPSSTGGVGFGVWQGAAYNCVVSTEAFDGWNQLGDSPVTANGGNADGYRNSYGAHHNTFIDSHAYRNSDDGFDFWDGGAAFVYFSSAYSNGQVPQGKTTTGDGNGFKLGRGDARHHLYSSIAYDNKAHGFDLTGNAKLPTLVECRASANGSRNWSWIEQ
jgi:hypothetical protein